MKLTNFQSADIVNHKIKMKLLSVLDLTLLNEEANHEEIRELIKKANSFPIAAVCVYPQHVPLISPFIQVNVATVANFPYGNDVPSQTLISIKKLVKNKQIQELDYVFPYSLYLKGDREVALAHCKKIYNYCQDASILFKVILETGALSNSLIYQLSRDILSSGCDFLKTSTGKIPQGATKESVTTILTAIKESHSTCGIKISGGIKTLIEAQEYVQLAQKIMTREINPHWFRIGASGLIKQLIS